MHSGVDEATPRGRAREAELERARAIVAEHGTDSLAPFALGADKCLAFCGGGLVAYRVVRDTVVVAADPVGPESCAGPAVRELRAGAREAGLRVVLYGCSARHLDAYRSLGLRAICVGEEAVVDPARFTLEGRAVRKLRQSVNRVQRRGWEVSSIRGRDIDAALAAEIERLEARWRAQQPQLVGFAMSLGNGDSTPRQDDLYVLARAPDGALCAVMRFLEHRGNLSLDVMRRVGETPNGLNEALIARALADARAVGVREVSLNYAGLAHLTRRAQDGGRLKRFVVGVGLRLLRSRFQLDRLVLFNEKFSPEWRPRYLVYESRLGLPRAALRVLQAEGYLSEPRPLPPRRRGQRRSPDDAPSGERAKPLRRRPARGASIVAALAVAALGLLGTYAYGRDYALHRGLPVIKRVPGAQRGRLLDEHFYSPALGRRTDYLIYLPPGYTRAHRYPVYYLLHGQPGDPQQFVDVAQMGTRLENLMAEHRARPMLLVYPDGRIDGNFLSDSEWANTPSGDYESAVLETVQTVDRRFATIRNRDARVLAGYSMGAYGAMNIGLHHLGDFAAIQAWSGYYLETHNGVFAHASKRTMLDNSPGDYITRLGPAIRRYPLRVVMYIGRADDDEPEQAPMARALRAAGAQVRANVYRGAHNWALWDREADTMIRLASFDMSHPPPRVRVRPGTRIVAVHARPRRGRRRHHGWSAARLWRMARRFRARRAAMVLGITGADPFALTSAPVPATAASRSPGRHHRSTMRLLAALLLALLASALINLGFVIQHRGHASARRRGEGRMRDVVRTPLWLLGQLTGWIGWGGQIVALALAPLALVQAFSAGGLALSVPLAAWLARQAVGRRQAAAIFVMGLALASLPLGGGSHGHLRDGLLIAVVLGLSAAAALGCLVRRASARAIAAGVLYGLAEAAIKADAVGLRHGGLGALASGWTIIAALATFGGFLAFQTSLRSRTAVTPMSLMTTVTVVTAVAIGATAFGETLGQTLVVSVLHFLAIALVIACVTVLVHAQQQLVPDQAASAADRLDEPAPRSRPPRSELGARRVAVLAMTRLGGALATAVAVLSATGLLYGLRELHWFDLGPRIADALPLLQLAGQSGQPLLRVLVAWIVVGLALGVALAGLSARSRLTVALPVALPLLLFASDASFALAQNVGLFGVLARRAPGLGPWLECLLLVAAAAAPARLGRPQPIGDAAHSPSPAPL